MAYNHVIRDIPIYKAALLDDWESVSEIFAQDPDLMTKEIGYWSETPLLLAVGTNRSHRFTKKLMESIVAVGATDRMFLGTSGGNTPIHYAAKVGNIIAARLLVAQNPDRTHIPNSNGNTPLKLAAWHVKKEVLQYLLTVTPNLPHTNSNGAVTTPYTGKAGGDLITLTIMAGFYDEALEILRMHPDIVFEEDRDGLTALQVLAMKTENFRSGCGLGFWGRLIYALIPLNKSGQDSKVNMFSKFATAFRKVLLYVAPSIIKIHDSEATHVQTNLLVKRICQIVIGKVDHDKAWKILGSGIVLAVKYGTRELIEECILTYPGIIWYDVGGFHLFHAAIKERQEQVYNLVFQMSDHKVFAADDLFSANDENALHVAAHLAPPHRLNVVTGAALQMQRELQWFKEVEHFIMTSYKEALNADNKTPRMLFTENHKDLLKDGQEWMKDTASSCTVVAALTVTMAFAAAFTVPGGNQDDGKPLFLNDGVFMLFIISDAIALFSSTTSVLMFLGILTSRYAEADFLYALPKRMTIGLVSLFLSLVATMIAFSATIALVLRGKVTWIAAPVVVATSIPACLFWLLQFPLLVEIVYSTYGPSIFRKQNNRWIH